MLRLSIGINYFFGKVIVVKKSLFCEKASPSSGKPLAKVYTYLHNVRTSFIQGVYSIEKIFPKRPFSEWHDIRYSLPHLCNLDVLRILYNNLMPRHRSS